MRATAWKVAAIAAALALTAGCGKKAPQAICRRRRATARMRAPRPAWTTGRTPMPAAAVGARLARRLPPERRPRGDRVFFDIDSYSLDDEDRATLDAQADWLPRNPNVRVTIEGHADERGTREYNLALGDRRANAAKNYLAAARRRRSTG